MKKLIYALIAVSLFSCNSKSEKKELIAPAAPELISVNGILESDAREMILDYKKDHTSAEPHTSFWFDERFLNTVISMTKVPGNKIDGIRLRLGKRGGKNTLIMLLTKDGGQNPDFPSEPTKRIHMEFFSPQSRMLLSIYQRTVDEHYKAIGANLYDGTDCPQAVCNNPHQHYVDCNTAHDMVALFTSSHGAQPLRITTRTVWYPISIIQAIKDDLDAGRKKGQISDGFRIYASIGATNTLTFIWTPTSAITGGHKDDYSCYLNVKKREEYDRGEECPAFCKGIILPDSIP
jgi:hypothetical protein